MLRATFLADFDNFTSAVKKAELDLKGMEIGAQKVQDKFNSMADSFSGRKIVQEANLVTESVGRLGGATALTAKEQARVNATLTEALAKYKALGQEAPKAMADLAEATKKIKPPLDQAGGAAGFLQSTFAQFTAAGLATQAISKITSEVSTFIATGAKLPAVEQSFARLSKSVQQDSAVMLANMTAGTKGMVSNYDLMLSANKAVLLDIPVTSASMGELAKTATTLGRAMGQDATKSLDDLIVALGRSSPRILDNLGLMVSVEAANERYAAKLHKSSDALTDAEKKMAFYEAAMEAARKKTAELGEQTQTLGEIATTVWTKIGNIVSSTSGDLNVSIGRIISSKKNLVEFMQDLIETGSVAAAAMAALARSKVESAGTVTGQFEAQMRRDLAAADAAKASLTSYTAELKKAQAGYSALTAEQKKNIEAAIVLGTSTDKIAAAMKVSEGVITIAKSAYEAHKQSVKQADTESKKYAETLKEIAAAAIPLTSEQQALAVSNQALGISAEKTGKALKISGEAVKVYLDGLKNGAEIAEIWRKAQEKMGDVSDKFIGKWVKDSQTAALKVADASGKALADQLSAREHYEEKNYQLTLNSTALTIRQIDLARDAAVAALTKQFDIKGPLFEQARTEIDAFYQHQKDVATGAASTIVERMRSAGVLTRSDLDKTAQTAKRDYEQMRASGVYTYEQLASASKKSFEAQLAAISGLKGVAARALYDELSGLASGLSAAISGDGSLGKAFADYGTNVAKDFTKTALAMIPGIGPILSEFAGPIIDGLKKAFGSIFGIGTAGRDKVLDFAQTFGGFDALHVELNTLGAEGERLWVLLTQGVGRNNPKEAEKAIEAITTALSKQKDKTVEAAQAAADSAKTQQDALDAISGKYADVISKLESEYKGLSDSVSKEAEEEFMGIVETQERARMKQIEGEKAAQEAMRDAELAAKKSTFDDMLEAGQKVDEKLRDIFGKPLQIPYEYVQRNAPGQGTYTPPSRPSGGDDSTQTIVVPVSVNGEVLTRAVVTVAKRRKL